MGRQNSLGATQESAWEIEVQMSEAENVPRKYQILSMTIWIGLGLFVMVASYRLGLGGFRSPGPGLMPFLLGLLLCLTALCKLFAFLLEKKDQGAAAVKEMRDRPDLTRLCLVMASLFVYSFVFESLGFVVATFMILLALFRIMNKKWSTVMLASILTLVVAYALFTYLGVKFPKGILKGL